jgi:hypothetical protein
VLGAEPFDQLDGGWRRDDLLDIGGGWRAHATAWWRPSRRPDGGRNPSSL